MIQAIGAAGQDWARVCGGNGGGESDWSSESLQTWSQKKKKIADDLGAAR